MITNNIIFNIIKDAIREMERCPDDSIQDIWNEVFCKWDTGLWMDHHYNIWRKDQRP